MTMNLVEILEQYGTDQEISPHQVLFGQGAASNGFYYLREGRLGVYHEEEGKQFLLSEILPGETVGELGAATQWPRTATVKAEVLSRVIFVPQDALNQTLEASPSLTNRIVCQIGERLTEADMARVSLSESYGRATRRVAALSSEKVRLEEYLRLREELSSMIIHDLRNPLSVLVASLRMLEEDILDKTNPDYPQTLLALMTTATRRMTGLVETLMDIAGLESGQNLFQVAALDLRALTANVLAEEQILARDSGISLENRVPGELPPALGDGDALQRVLINLVDNALKFTPVGGRVWIEAGSENVWVWVAVVDTGPGIPAGERERIFEKFTQVRGIRGARRGSGLGLAFCRMAIEAQGGRVWVEDGSEGQGSRFIFTLPRFQ